MKVTSLVATFGGVLSASVFLSKQVNLAPEVGLPTKIDTTDPEVFTGPVDKNFGVTNVTIKIANGPNADCKAESIDVCSVESDGLAEFPRCITHKVFYMDMPIVNEGAACKTVIGTMSPTDETCNSDRCLEGKIQHSDPYCIGGFTDAKCKKNSSGDCVFVKTFRITRQAYGKGEKCAFDHGFEQEIGFCPYDACK